MLSNVFQGTRGFITSCVMRLEKCYFCSSTVYPGHGMQFVRNDCKIFNFCRAKCHKAFKRKKNPRRTKWTKAYRKAAGKELTNDPCLEFEKRRDIPLRYDRETWTAAVETIKKVQKIRQNRENLHIKTRLKKGKVMRQKRDVVNMKKNIALIRAPGAQKSKTAEGEAMELGDEVKEEALMEEN